MRTSEELQGKAVDEGMLKSFLEVFNRHDLHVVMSFFSEDCPFDMSKGSSAFGTRYIGKSAVQEGLADRFSMPGVHYGLIDISSRDLEVEVRQKGC